MNRALVIIPAAGMGTRFGGDIPKQFRVLAGKPILQHVLERFFSFGEVVRIVVALPEVLLPGLADPATDRVRFVAGGETRQDSVIRALEAAGEDFDLIAVHDAVRPFFRRSTFATLLNVAAEHGAALPVLPVVETIHVVDDDFIIATPARSSLFSAQTPQCFRAPILRDVLTRAVREGLSGTDEAEMASRFGHRVRVIPGDPFNLKITHADDLAMAEVHFSEWTEE